MRAFVLHGKENLRREDLARPRPQPGQVLVRVRRTGICGSDVHYFRHGRVGNFVPKRPFVLGHEFAGEVVEAGVGVTGLEVGMRVAIDPSQPCGACRHCRSGRYNLCENMRYFGSASCDPHLDGGFAEFVAVPARNCHEMPAGMDWGEAAMLEPLSVALHAALRAGPVAGRSVLVTGGGAIGQLVALAVRALGAGCVALSDPVAFPRRFAAEMGADAVIDPADPASGQKALDLTDSGFDCVFEAAGSAPALAQALHVARRGGTIVQVGTLPPEVPLPANLIMTKELNVLGSFRFAHVFPMALQFVASRRINVAPLISQTFPFEETLQAMARAASKDNVIKVQIES
ncbi:MAG: L-idonate 5-dehydrogenase [Opitutaceae bacterium]|nr:L-idonate 5-dehydrogenase [Opitutaceae bacterium]